MSHIGVQQRAIALLFAALIPLCCLVHVSHCDSKRSNGAGGHNRIVKDSSKKFS